MKARAADFERALKAPSTEVPGYLLYSSEPTLASDARRRLLAALLGPGAEDEMRLTRLQAGDVRKDGALVSDGLKAQGFFPGPRVVLVDEATDAVADAIRAALADWQAGDATLVVSAGALGPRSRLRKMFEDHDRALAVAFYPQAPDRRMVETLLSQKGVLVDGPDTLAALVEIGAAEGPAGLADVIEKLSLFLAETDTPADLTTVQALAPAQSPAELDAVLAHVADARLTDLGPALARLFDQGTAPVTVCLTATRHFRALLKVATDGGGPRAGVAKLRPPVFGPRRDQIVAQASRWGSDRLEKALGVLIDTDLTLRSAGRTAPDRAVVERALIRLTMLGR